MAQRKAGRGKPSRADIDDIIIIAEAFLSRMRQTQTPHTLREAMRSASRRVVPILNRFPPLKGLRAPGLGSPGCASRDPQRAASFLIDLFGFVAAVRTLRHFLFAIAARTAGEIAIRGDLESSPLIVFHKDIGDQGLHNRIIETSRLFVLGGTDDATWHYTYAAHALDRDVEATFELVQEEAAGGHFGVVALGAHVLGELRYIDRAARTAGWY